MKVQNVGVKNFRGIDWEYFEPKGNHVYLSGKNGSGKTSLIDAIFNNIPDLPLKQGSTKGETIVELDGYTIIRKYSTKNAKGKLTIVDDNGEEQKSPATLLKKLFGLKHFDVPKFLDMSARDKKRVVEKLIGVDFSELDKEYKSLYDQRKALNAQIKAADAMTKGFAYNHNIKEIDTSEIESRINKANSLLQEKRAYNNQLSSIESEEQRLKERLKEIQKEKEFLESSIVAIKVDDVDALNAELDKARENNLNFKNSQKFLAVKEEAMATVRECDKVQARMDEIEQTKADELKNNPIPVRGMEFNGDDLMLDGLPFSVGQVNKAREIIAGLELGYAHMGEAKVAYFDASLIDKDNEAEILKWADDRGIQLFMELVDRTGGSLKIEIIEE